MIKEKLESYNAAAMETAIVEEELTRFHQVQDKVKGSMPEYPYILQNIQITGVDPTVAGKLEARRDKLAKMRAEVEQFLAGVDDPYMASLLRLRYVKGKTWLQIAMQVGGGNTPDGIRKTVERFLAKR